MKRNLIPSILLGGIVLDSCSTNGSSNIPGVTQANLNNNTLEFAVGTANFNGSTDLNTVVSFRQPNGNSAVLVDTPTITGPAGFGVPNVASAGTDAGTNHISGSPQQITPAPPATTFGTQGGAFSYGFGPYNITQSGSAKYVGNPPPYAQPFYNPQRLYVGGPPAYPFFNDGTFPSGFLGYLQGFTAFETAPALGTYTLSVLVAASNAPSQTFTASGTLASAVPLPILPAPTFVGNGAGGGSGTVTVPADPRILETIVYVNDQTPSDVALGSPGKFYTAGPLRGTGALAYAIPGNLGPCVG
ncbi:MAG: hypothetical protein NVS9B12_12750 [Vulcanimicrobiaceae bacterium]